MSTSNINTEQSIPVTSYHHQHAHYKKRQLKKKKNRARKRAVFCLGLILTCAWVLRLKFAVPSNSNFQTTDLIPYKKVLKMPLNDITTSLSSSELNDPIFTNLISETQTYPKAKILIANHSAYPKSLLELAGNRPESLDFVIDYINYQNKDSSISIEKDYHTGTIPLFIQWDKRWGYDTYGNDFIAYAGCGPTSLAMVTVGLTGNTDMNPKEVADFSYINGYYVAEQGTSWTLMSEGAENLGLISEQIPLDSSSIYNALENGEPIIASMRPGHFTKTGHFIVLTGVTSNGQITVNDPASIINSHKAWDLNLIINEAKNLWGYRVNS